MFDIIIYKKDGRRQRYDHVAQITNISDNVVIDFITDFGQQTNVLNKDNVEYMTVRIMQ